MTENHYFAASGGQSYSGFRLGQIVEELAVAGYSGEILSIRNLYLGQYSRSPDDSQKQALLNLIPDADLPELPAGQDGIRLFVVPRVGTVSPWSSKATDIARVCGLEGLQRVERGRVIDLSCMPEPVALGYLHDRMTESVLTDSGELIRVFEHPQPRPLRIVPLQEEGAAALHQANTEWGLALSDEEIDYLAQHYSTAGRDPTDAELMMFAQINSEHCRHKIFNAAWEIDGETQPHSLFEMIRMTHAAAPEGVLSAYSDNSAVIEGSEALDFRVAQDRSWQASVEDVPVLMKVETHNHPTAISPFPGAATGAGGEIRDEAATGRGGRAKAGLCGFSVSNLNIPGAIQAWEKPYGKPASCGFSAANHA